MHAGFTDIGVPGRPARVLLEQIGDTRFRLLRGFTYRDAHGGVHHVFSWHLTDTDLASIPPAFSWLEGRTGRHTLAGLLHDQQIAVIPDDPLSPAYLERRVAADDRFLEALGVLGVAWVRRHVMWAAVHALTRSRHLGAVARLAMATWAVLCLVGTSLFVWSLTVGRWDVTLVAALAPIPAAALWAARADNIAKRVWCGVVAGFGVVGFLPTAALTLVVVGFRDLLDLLTGGTGDAPWAFRSAGGAQFLEQTGHVEGLQQRDRQSAQHWDETEQVEDQARAERRPIPPSHQVSGFSQGAEHG